MHSLLAHHSSWNPVFFVTQFVDGLRSNIRLVVLHRPQDLDPFVALACLHEEVLEATRGDPHRMELSPGAHSVLRTALPLPPPPGKATPVVGLGQTIRETPKGQEPRLLMTHLLPFVLIGVQEIFAIPAVNDGLAITSVVQPCSPMWWKSCGKCC